MGSPVLVSHAIHLCVHVCLHEYMPRMCGCVQNTEKVLDALELELEAAGKQLTRMLGIQIPLRSGTLTPLAICSALSTVLVYVHLVSPHSSLHIFFSQALWFK